MRRPEFGMGCVLFILALLSAGCVSVEGKKKVMMTDYGVKVAQGGKK